MYWETCDLNREEPIQRKSPFIDFWLCQVFIAVWAFLQLWQVGAALQLQCMGFSLQWLLQWEQNLQGMWAFIVAAPGVQSVHSIVVTLELGCQVALVVKNTSVNAEDRADAGLIPGSGRFPREGHGNPLQYSCLENPMDRGGYRGRLQFIGLQREGHG